MSESKTEEIIAALWLIAGLLAHSIGWSLFGWILIVKAASDCGCSIGVAIKKQREGKTK